MTGESISVSSGAGENSILFPDEFAMGNAVPDFQPAGSFNVAT